jgi:hypothetical protein
MRIMNANEDKQLKPFSLEAALKGEKVITRDGREVTEIYHLKTLSDKNYPILAIVEGRGEEYTLNGRYYVDFKANKDDLFMAPKERVVWVNTYVSSNEEIWGTVYASEDKADKAADGAVRIGNRAYPITIEEE